MKNKLEFTLVSDLHLDFGLSGPVLPGGRLLIIAGDLCESKSLTFNDNLNAVEREKRRNVHTWLNKQAEIYDHIVMVMGNHEHYHSKFHKTVETLRANLPAKVTVLDKETVEIDGVLIIGATLWADANDADPLTIYTLKDMMRDFHAITYKNGETYTRFLPNHAIYEHRRTVDYIKNVLHNPANEGKPVIVVTHHAPTFNSVGEAYVRDTLMNGGYASNLSDLILDHPQIAVWCHGHIHSISDYEVGDTRVLCNPWGYHEIGMSGGNHEYTGFDPDVVFAVETK